jgi:hypothetical protein
MTPKPKDGGAAFPTVGVDNGAAMNGIGVSVTDQPGMTLRDWFAGQALQAGILSITAGERAQAEQAYRYADAMLDARVEEGEKP